MGQVLDKLLEIGSKPISEKFAAVSSESIFTGRVGAELRELLARKNGFYAFESALHVFPFCSQPDVVDLAKWNSPKLWRQHYGDLAQGCVFFGEDVFGFQFAIKDDLVWSFDAETGSLTEVGESLEAWAQMVLGDYEFHTGYPFAHEWQAYNRPLLPTERLFPKFPFVLGGKYAIDNLVASNAVYGMQFRGYVAQHIKDLPEGTKVEFVFDPLN